MLPQANVKTATTEDANFNTAMTENAKSNSKVSYLIGQDFQQIRTVKVSV